MSFILDALKKSEAERSREAGPALINMRIVPPRRRMPLWIIALTVILLANLAVLAMVLLRTPAGRSPASSAAPVTEPAAQLAATTPAASAPAAEPANVLPPPVLLPEPVPAREALPPVTVAPRVNPRPVPPQPLPPARNEDAQLPDATDLRLAGVTLPELRLSLHVFDNNPASRYVLLNSKQLREGEGTGDGLVLERVTPTGVVLSFNGQRFRLEAGQ